MNDKLTKSDIKKIEEEIEYRKSVVRPELLEEVKETRAQGDLSENFEYHAAKREKNRNESRIRYLERMIKTAQVIDDSSEEDEVGINNTVTIYIEGMDMEQTVRLVTTVRGDVMNGLISIDSPVGQALLGHKEGDRVHVQVNDTIDYYAVIKKIEKTDDDSNDKIRGF